LNSNVRIIASIALIGLAIWGFMLVSGEQQETPKVVDSSLPDIPENSVGGKLTLKASAECAECHAEIYKEWKGSQHEFAWLNPEPRRKELSNNFRNKDCIPCHAPRPLLEVGFGDRALERETRREEGVNCFTCHRFNDVVVGPNDMGAGAALAPCKPVKWAPVSRVMLCTPCHDQHKVEQDWLGSRFADKEGGEYQDCNDCHMPVLDGPGTIGGARPTHRGHGFKGGHDPAILKTAGIVRAKRFDSSEEISQVVAELTSRKWQAKAQVSLDRGILIEVKNTGTGHNFPSDERHRAVDLYARFVPEKGKPTEEVRLVRFRNPYRHEFEKVNPFKDKPGVALTAPLPWAGAELQLTQVRILPEFNPTRKVFYPESTQLHAGESRLLWFDFPEWGKGTLQLRLYYKLQPFLGNDAAVEVSSFDLSF
jgi:hypothetical protein